MFAAKSSLVGGHHAACCHSEATSLQVAMQLVCEVRDEMGCMLQKAPACLGMSLHCRQNCTWLRHLEQGLCLSLLSPQNDMLVLLAAAQGKHWVWSPWHRGPLLALSGFRQMSQKGRQSHHRSPAQGSPAQERAAQGPSLPQSVRAQLSLPGWKEMVSLPCM